MEHEAENIDNIKKKDKNIDNIKMEDEDSYKDSGSGDESVEEEHCSDATYLARQMASAERLCQSDTIVIILKQIQCNKIFVSGI